ncbi:MAG TPA: DoxX family membrane protein [Acetobacteraceae bacterium]|nr:DoxX family membrane protein [Acetobacteraceae bacterium]
MRPNPVVDVFHFLTKPAGTTVVFWLLLLGSIVIAARARMLPGQNTPRHAAIWLLRLTIGCLWWQQSLWKLPPQYSGLIYWMKQMVAHASTHLQSALVADVVLPNITIFGPLVYLTEVAIGVSLMLGLFTRLGALAGAAMAINLWLGLYSAPGEWPWTYAFLVVIQLLFLVDPPGRSLGADVLLAARERVRPVLRWAG